MKQYKTLMETFDKVNGTMSTASGRLVGDGHYSINFSSIATDLIQNVGRFAERYASDFLINWKGVEELLQSPNSGRYVIMFGIREDGVDGNNFVVDHLRGTIGDSFYGYCDAVRAGYRKLLAVEVRFNESDDGAYDDGAVRMTLKDFSHALIRMCDEDIPSWDMEQKETFVKKLMSRGDSAVKEFLDGNGTIFGDTEDSLRESVYTASSEKLMYFVKKYSIRLPSVNNVVMNRMLEDSTTETQDEKSATEQETSADATSPVKQLGKNFFFFEVPADPFEYYSNACGDIFVHDANNQCETNDIPSSAYLPFPLQYIYMKFWMEGEAGLLNYLVRNPITDEFGLLLRSEFISEKAEESKDAFTEDMESIWKETCVGKGGEIANVLAKYVPNAKVYIGKYAGVDGCHNLDFFIPASESENSIATAICILTEAFKGLEIEAPTEVSADEVTAYLNGRPAAACKIFNESDEDFFVKFREAGTYKPIMCVKVSPHDMSNTVVNSDVFIRYMLPEACAAVMNAMKAANYHMSASEVIRYALSAAAPFRWQECDEAEVPTAPDTDVQVYYLSV